MAADRIIEPTWQIKPPGIGPIAPRPVNWYRTLRWRASWRTSCNSSGHRAWALLLDKEKSRQCLTAKRSIVGVAISNP